MNLEQIEQMVRTANPVPDVAILAGSVAHREHLNGEQVGDVVDRDAHTTAAVDLARERHRRGRWLLVAAAAIVVLALGLLAVAADQDSDSVETNTVPSTAAPPTNPATTSPLRPSPPVDSTPATSGTAPPTSVTVPASAPATSGGMWPQSTLNEVRAAQELADAGDAAYTWQLDDTLAANEEPWEAEILVRFIEEELAWEKFTSGPSGSGYVRNEQGGRYEGVMVVRCAPGQTNPLSPLYADAPAEIRGCAPTIDEFTYETVTVNLTQPERRGPSGIWVVERWDIPQQSEPDPGSLWGIMNPEFAGQVWQAAPPSDADVSTFLEAFLRARVNGEGAEQYLLREPVESPFEDQPVPLLYTTTSGAPYERSEIERVQGPVWPNGLMQYKVRLFAEDGSVVEQRFYVVRDGGQLGLVYGYVYEDIPTTENGQSVAVPFSFLDGEVSFAVASQLYLQSDDPTVMQFGSGTEHVVIAADPQPVQTGCDNGPAPADADALARSIAADPEFETIEPVAVRIAGVDGLQVDGMVPAPWDGDWSVCHPMWTTDAEQFRIRLYLIDYPGESAQILTIAVIAPETDFEHLLEQATPTVESLELHTG